MEVNIVPGSYVSKQAALPRAVLTFCPLEGVKERIQGPASPIPIQTTAPLGHSLKARRSRNNTGVEQR